VEICTDGIKAIDNIDPLLIRKLRASYYLLGAGLGRFGYAHMAYPGGCNIGSSARPIDQHAMGFEKLGSDFIVSDGAITVKANGALIASTVDFNVVTVGATLNIMLAAALTPGTTIIKNAAREPHIVDLAAYLNTCGANIRSVGTDTIKITGVSELHGSYYEVVPDMIEAGTYMAAVAAAGGRVEIRNVIPVHLNTVTVKLREMGVTVEEYDESVVVYRDPKAPMKPTGIVTAPYPAFPTDMQPQMCAVMCVASGLSNISEKVWDNRFKYTSELEKMGAVINVSSGSAQIEGGHPLTGAEVLAVDLRGGAAVVIAALAAEGITVISDIEYIERGYDDISKKLSAVGASIKKVSYPD
jgi:UDP-N-acetylglucosamine 1-carboxyvinyltransferase